MEAFDIREVNHRDLKRGKYKKFIPEIYELNGVVENSPWHLNQNVFDHTVLVLKSLESLLNSLSTKKSGGSLNKALDSKLGKYRKRDLLKLAALYHDIGKSETIEENEKGTTSCPDHEAAGAKIAAIYFDKFSLTKDQIDYLKRLITLHTVIIDYLKKIDEKDKEEYYLSEYKKHVGELYLELMFLFHSDLVGSDLKKSEPEKYEKYKSLVEDLIKRV